MKSRAANDRLACQHLTQPSFFKVYLSFTARLFFSWRLEDQLDLRCGFPKQEPGGAQWSRSVTLRSSLEMKTIILLWILAAIGCSTTQDMPQQDHKAALDKISSKNGAPGGKGSETLHDESKNGISNEESKERQERAVPPAVAEVGTEIVTDLVKQAVDKQIKIIEEQQQKAQEFINKKLELNIEPEKGWKTESMYAPAGVHVDAEYTSEDKDEEDFIAEQPFAYPMGIGGVMMNGCYGTNYEIGDPCYDFKTASPNCHDLIDGAAFIGVGFDGRGDYSPESRKMSIVQRVCAGKATYDDAHVPDTMNVHGVYDTSTTMHSFYSRQEYQTWLQQQAGMAGSFFGFFGGVKKAWGSSSLTGSEKYMSLLSIDIDRYEIYLDEVKPNDLSVNFLQEFMDLPTSYLAPGAAIKFQNFILRWGTHYIKSGKFGGRLQIFKTMDASQVSSKEEFSQVMEVGYKSLFGSFHAKDERSGGSSAKSQAKTSSTSVSVEGGDQEIAAIITDFNSPTIKYDLTKWLASIATFPKPFKFMVAPIIDLLKFNPSSLFPSEERNWGCEAHTADMKQDPDTKEHYYEVKVNGTLTRKLCPYKDRDDLIYLIERRRNGLERAIAVYMEEGAISASDITLPAGRPGCQTENYKFQEKAGKPSWKDMTEGGATFLVIFNTRQELQGSFNGPVKISPRTEKYVRYFKGEWLVGESRDQIDLITGCNRGDLKKQQICILGLVLRYNDQTGFFTMAKEDFDLSKETFPNLVSSMTGSLIAHAEWPSEHIFSLDKVIGYLPCNVKWSNVLRFDPSNEEGKCLHFTASSKGTIFVIFAAVPNNKDTWYYVQISPYGVGIFKSQKLMVSTVDVNAVGLGVDILYQSYFVCLKETWQSTVIEYGKSQATTEKGDVYLTMIDRDDPLFVRFYSFGNGEKPLDLVDAHIISRHLTKANCRGDTVLDKLTNMCVQHCHELCDPTQGCRGASSSTPLATNCNACRYVKNAATGECLKECPEGWKETDDKTCKVALPCDAVQCFNGGSCSNLDEEKFKCSCVEGFKGDYCEKEDSCHGVQCLNGGSCTSLDAGKFKCNCVPGFEGEKCEKEARYYTCKEFLLKGKATENKAFSLAVGISDKISVYCHMTELGACGGGGWTLVMKIDGNKNTFPYDSELWTNNKYYNLEGGATGFDFTETKLPMYHRAPFSKICLGMKVNDKSHFIVINKAAHSLYKLIADGQYRETKLGRSTWKKLIGSAASLQYNCNKEGFNAVCGGSTRIRARIGIISNNENNCYGCDSRIGFGTQKTPTDSNTCGNVQTYAGDNGNKFTKAMGYILVQ